VKTKQQHNTIIISSSIIASKVADPLPSIDIVVLLFLEHNSIGGATI